VREPAAPSTRRSPWTSLAGRSSARSARAAALFPSARVGSPYARGAELALVEISRRPRASEAKLSRSFLPARYRNGTCAPTGVRFARRFAATADAVHGRPERSPARQPQSRPQGQRHQRIGGQKGMAGVRRAAEGVRSSNGFVGRGPPGPPHQAGSSRRPPRGRVVVLAGGPRHAATCRPPRVGGARACAGCPDADKGHCSKAATSAPGQDPGERRIADQAGNAAMRRADHPTHGPIVA